MTCVNLLCAINMLKVFHGYIIYVLRLYHCIDIVHALVFEEAEDPANRSFFSEIISSVSDVKFSHDGRYILSRDYLTLKIWDINMENKPVQTIYIHDQLRSRLCDLYENDCIFDKFECTFSGDGK